MREPRRKYVALSFRRNRNVYTPGSNPWNSVDYFSSKYTYDANGNIKTLQRTKYSTTKFDDLTYDYSATDNKLKYVQDAIGNSIDDNDIDNQTNTENYKYDAIGNMIRDEAEQLSITWLPNGKIATVTKDGVWQLRFAYDATGTRVRKSKYTGATYTTHEKTTWYVHEAGGKQLATYEMLGTNTNATLTEVPLLGTARLGMDQPDVVRTDNAVTESNITYRITGKKLYETTDHLGNVRTVIGDVKLPEGSTFAVDLKSYSNYYPFGMQQQHRCYQSADYRYGYNGKEKDDEVKGSGAQYDYGFRIYDPRVARFLSVDPLTKDYPSWSPYPFAMNRCIDGVDLDGLEFTKYSQVGIKPLTVKNATIVHQQISSFQWVGGVKIYQPFAAFLTYSNLSPLIQRKIENVANNTSMFVVEDAGDPSLKEEFWYKEVVNGIEVRKFKDAQSNKMVKVTSPTTGTVSLTKKQPEWTNNKVRALNVLTLVQSYVQEFEKSLIELEAKHMKTDFAFAVRAVNLVLRAADMNLKMMPEYYRTDANGQAILANYILDGRLPMEDKKNWKKEDIEYLKKLGDYIYNNREKLEAGENP